MKTDEPKLSAAAKELAGAYTRTFATEDGRRVLEDIQAKFCGHRLRNLELIRWIANPQGPAPSPSGVIATIIDGQASVVTDIAAGILAGKHDPDNTQPQP